MSKKILKAVAVVVAIIAIAGAYKFPQQIAQSLGATPSAEYAGPFWSVGGVQHWYSRVKMVNSTTTPCAIKSPNATSSYVFTSVQVTTASSTATTWTAARALTPYATTTALGSFSLSSGVLGSMVVNASTTTAVDGAGILPPNTYVVWGMAGVGSTYDATKLNGFCSAEFVAL